MAQDNVRFMDLKGAAFTLLITMGTIGRTSRPQCKDDITSHHSITCDSSAFPPLLVIGIAVYWSGIEEELEDLEEELDELGEELGEELDDRLLVVVISGNR